MDSAKVADWFVRFRKPVRNWLRNRLGISNCDIDDISQEVFLRLLRYDSHELVENPMGYLFRITSNVVAEQKALKRNTMAHQPEWLEELADQSELDRLELSEYINSILNELPPRRREILILHAYSEISYKQIAVKLGLTYRIVLRELVKAYTALRAKAITDGMRN